MKAITNCYLSDNLVFTGLLRSTVKVHVLAAPVDKPHPQFGS